MLFRNDLCDRLGIEYPLLQGAMAWIAGGRLAAAVSEAGGLGVIGAGGADAAWIKTEIQKARQLTSRPFGINLMLASSDVEMQIDTVIEEKVPIVTTGSRQSRQIHGTIAGGWNPGHSRGFVGGPGQAHGPAGSRRPYC